MVVIFFVHYGYIFAVLWYIVTHDGMKINGIFKTMKYASTIFAGF